MPLFISDVYFLNYWFLSESGSRTKGRRAVKEDEILPTLRLLYLSLKIPRLLLVAAQARASLLLYPVAARLLLIITVVAPPL